ncbi:hypothetical protein GCM10017586_11490 [Microbacterium imperiale]|uniref:Uncharacterized protein n=1 Tax=Microbacterium imperiale TaxID=33884 RepID=A0A9W6HGL6_9MICO|nr:hypothetical protein GCM10017544_05140 [Microbacterium imperiale]GLJ79467.1 hypothetical protein GCM10017586_11490 [Microbacterium imperiale]
MPDEQDAHISGAQGVSDEQQVGSAGGVRGGVVVDEAEQPLIEHDVVALCGQIDPGVLAAGQSGKGQGFLLGGWRSYAD